MRDAVIQYHLCEYIQEMNSKGIEVGVQEESPGGIPGWYFVRSLYATEQDVYDGEAEEIGEEISSSAMLIFFCPFCGLQLKVTGT